MDPHVAQNLITPYNPPSPPDYTFTFSMMAINGKDSSRRETRLHPVVRQSAPHPGNNLVANWLEDGENWKLKLEILIINREGGEKKVRRCGAAMRLARLANEVFCLSWNVCDMPLKRCRDIKARKKEKKKDYLAIWGCREFSDALGNLYCALVGLFFSLQCHFLWQANMSRSWYVGLQ